MCAPTDTLPVGELPAVPEGRDTGCSMARLERDMELHGAGSGRPGQGPSSRSTGDSVEGLEHGVTSELFCLGGSPCRQCGLRSEQSTAPRLTHNCQKPELGDHRERGETLLLGLS